MAPDTSEALPTLPYFSDDSRKHSLRTEDAIDTYFSFWRKPKNTITIEQLRERYVSGKMSVLHNLISTSLLARLRGV